MTGLRLAELREGVWMRPANLVRERDATALEQCDYFLSRPARDAGELARCLWDLDGWAVDARRLHGLLGDSSDLVDGFLLTAEVLHHLLIDPVLPVELLPADWPGEELRSRYLDFSVRYAQRLREYALS
jgi:phenylacetic acid degradation operon negative regulatory protein